MSGNPSGKRQRAGAWDVLQDDQLAAVWITRSDGKRVHSTRAAVTITQLFQKALKGNRDARRELRREIIELDEQGLLSPPEVVKRPKRIPDMIAKGLQRIGTPTMKAQMIELCARRFDCTIPDITTDYERSLGLGSGEASETPPLPPKRRKTSEHPQDETAATTSAPSGRKGSQTNAPVASSKPKKARQQEGPSP